MGVIVIGKIYHHTNSPSLSTPYRIERDEYWIKELGTASPYGCNDNVSSIGNLTSPSYSYVNVMHLFPSFNRKKRSHGTRHYTPPRNNRILFNDLLNWIFRPLGIHHIRTKLFSIPLPSLNKLHLNCSIINNVYKTGASPIMSMIVLLVLALRHNSSTNQLDI